MKKIIHSNLARLTVLVMLAWMLLPVAGVSAAQLNNRKLTLGTSQGNTSTTWTIQFDPGATTALNGITFQVCDSASGTCNIPGSWTNTGSAFSSLTYNGSAQTGWTLDNAAGFLRIKNNASVVTTAAPIVATFNTVTNPNTTNATFFVRILTYTGDDYTGQLDSGVVAASTAQQFTVSASIDESLTFCVGASGITTSSCAGATGSTASLGTLSASATGSTFSQLGVGTNAVSGYSITVTGTTLTSGGNTITALASQTASAVGGEQFGINLRDNATPNVGLDPDGSGTAAPTTNYNTVDQYRFVSGDSIASKNTSDSFRRFHVSYIANIGTASEPGSYSTALTYICTAAY
jgi:hypothetical protein